MRSRPGIGESGELLVVRDEGDPGGRTIEIDSDPPTVGRLVLGHAGKQRRRAVEHVACFADGKSSVGGSAGQMKVLDRPLRLAGPLEVKPEDRCEFFSSIRILGLNCLADLTMELAPICLQERLVGGLLDEDVAKSKDRLGVYRRNPQEA